METTFITIHDLSAEARILYASDSVVDVLGFTPDEVVDRPCWDFFQPHGVEQAKKLHARGVELDRAAVLVYCDLTGRGGNVVQCECCFTCVYNVMVVCTSEYRGSQNSHRRAEQAPGIRRLFTSSPNDPRYHMLSHLSSKFQRDVTQESHEPRAALFLNRFTRTLTIMYATSGIEQVIGINGEDMKGRSFYYCIAENCLEDAVRCLEGAKGNDSIAYLRFWFRDPRQDDQPPSDASDAETEEDSVMTDVTDTEDDEEEEGGVRLDVVPPPPLGSSSGSGSTSRDRTTTGSADTEAGPSEHRANTAAQAGRAQPPSTPASTGSGSQDPGAELEAVVSCTSDGLVVILRRARPLVPNQLQSGIAPVPTPAPIRTPPRGVFAAPWAAEPIFIPEVPRPADGWYHGMHPQYVQPAPAVGGPSPQDFMNSIRDVAVFAWALVGINGTLADYSRGRPGASSQPNELPVWEAQSVDSGHVTGTEGVSPDPFGPGGAGDNGLARG